MPGPSHHFLSVGLALSGALLATVGLPGQGSGHEAATAALQPAVVLSTMPASTVTLAAPITPTTLAHVRTTPVPVRTAQTAPVTRKAVQHTVARPARPASHVTRTDSPCSGTGWEQRRGQAALRSLKPAAGNGYSVRFLGAKKGFYGLTRPSLRAVEVYVRACTRESDELLRHVLAHEIGHAYDKTRLTDAQRRAYKAARGIPASTPWFGCSRCTDFAIPAGDFAEVYSQWRRGASTNRSQLGNAPSQAGLNALAQRFFGD